MQKNLTKTSVIILSEIDWNYVVQRHHIFTLNYAKKGHPVIYVNRMGTRGPKSIKDYIYIFKRLFNSKKLERGLVKYPSNVSVISPFFAPYHNFIGRSLNKFIFIPAFLKKIGYQSSNNYIFHVYLPYPVTFDILSAIKNKKIIYDCVHSFDNHPNKIKRILFLEKKLIQLAQCTSVDSYVVYNNLKHISDSVLFCPPGVDFNHFSQSFRGDEHLKMKKLVFFGTIREYLNFKLINTLTRSNKFDITFVGIDFLGSKKSKLFHHSNKINFFPAIPYQDLPLFLKKYDALLLPYNDDISNFFFPAKTFECFATGKPIIASEIKSLKNYDHLIQMISEKTLDSDEELAEVIKTHPSHKNFNEKQEIAKNMPWKKQFDSIYKTLY